ncbi:MAG: iron-containing redox enzyme family protein [Acidobacteriota bacterium]
MEPSISTETRFIDELLVILAEEKFRDPVFDAVRKGTINREAVKLWILQASLVVCQFTRFISAIHANCPHRDAQQLLAENLWEEHGRGASGSDHYSLITKLARSLGATDQEIDDARPLPETAAYIDLCLKITREQSFVASMTAIALGIEVFMPAFFGVLAESLCANYGLTRDDVEYLLVHVSEDETHSRRAIELIETYARTDEVKESARRELREMLQVKRQFAEAVYRHCCDASRHSSNP